MNLIKKISPAVSLSMTAFSPVVMLLVILIIVKAAWIIMMGVQGALELSVWEWVFLPMVATYMHIVFVAVLFGIYLFLLHVSKFFLITNIISKILIIALQGFFAFYCVASFRVGMITGGPFSSDMIYEGIKGSMMMSFILGRDNRLFLIISLAAIAILIFLPAISSWKNFLNKHLWSWPCASVLSLWITAGFLAQPLYKSYLAFCETDPALFTVLDIFDQESGGGPAEKGTAHYSTKVLYGNGQVEITRSHFRNIKKWKKTNRNIILVVLESVPAKRASFMGQVLSKGKTLNTTPELLKLRNNMLVMKNHYTVHPTSMNALFSISCSLYPPPKRGTITNINPQIPCNSISEILAKKGYKSLLVHPGKFSFWNKLKFFNNRGFDVLLDAKNLPVKKGDYKFRWGVEEKIAVKAITDFIRKNKKRSFFVEYIMLFPHNPYNVPSPKYNYFPVKDDVDKYHNAIRYVDSQISKLVQNVKKMGLEKDTLFIIAGDHGEAFGEHPGNKAHSIYLYEENVHVAFGMYNPLLFKGAPTVNRVTSHLDILPTIADIVGIKKDKIWDGYSIFRNGPSHIAYFYANWSHRLQGMRDGRFKVVKNTKSNKFEIFDLKKDPEEKKNLASMFSKRLKKYSEYLSKWAAYNLTFIPNFKK